MNAKPNSKASAKKAGRPRTKSAVPPPRYTKPPRPKALTIITEPERGVVPSSTFGKLDTNYNSYLEEIGLSHDLDNEKTRPIVHALALSNDLRFKTFLERLSSPGARRQSLAAIAKRCELTLPQFAEFWQKAQHTQALAIAQSGIVSVTRDMVKDAQSLQGTCERCDGFGWCYVEDGLKEQGVEGITNLNHRDPTSRQIRTCPNCKGTGSVLRAGSTDARKLLLGMVGMGGKSGPSVVVNQNFGGASIDSAISRLSNVTYDTTAEDVTEAPVDPPVDLPVG